jgi:hypothetical protein
VNVPEVDGIEAMGVRGKKDRLKGERRDDLGGEGGWSGVTRERAMKW